MSSLFLLPDPLNFRGILRVVETNWTGIRDKCPLLRVECSPFAPLSAAQASPAASPLSRRFAPLPPLRVPPSFALSRRLSLRHLDGLLDPDQEPVHASRTSVRLGCLPPPPQLVVQYFFFFFFF
jgi:hypothetical protein